MELNIKVTPVYGKNFNAIQDDSIRLKVVYFHINPLTNKVFYVGIGDKYRPYSKLHRNKYWKNTVKKYGYIVDIIETNLTWEEACIKEKFYIKWFGKENLTNMTDGGEGGNGRICTEETKRKISKAKSGISNGPHKSETIIKMKEKRKLQKFNDETKIKMKVNQPNIFLLLNIETGIYYNGIKEAAFTLNLNHVTLKRHIKNNKTSLIKV